MLNKIQLLYSQFDKFRDLARHRHKQDKIAARADHLSRANQKP